MIRAVSLFPLWDFGACYKVNRKNWVSLHISEKFSNMKYFSNSPSVCRVVRWWRTGGRTDMTNIQITFINLRSAWYNSILPSQTTYFRLKGRCTAWKWSNGRSQLQWCNPYDSFLLQIDVRKIIVKRSLIQYLFSNHFMWGRKGSFKVYRHLTKYSRTALGTILHPCSESKHTLRIGQWENFYAYGDNTVVDLHLYL
jgi:hypothetical protein